MDYKCIHCMAVIALNEPEGQFITCPLCSNLAPRLGLTITRLPRRSTSGDSRSWVKMEVKDANLSV
jgi:hypothetical protein